MGFEIQRQRITNDSFSGTLFSPVNQGSFPGVIVIPGSDGRIPEAIAKYIASHGYCALALGYFGLRGLPDYLENIPLEYFQKAIEHFKEFPQVRDKSVILMGYSRGGELVLLLASLFPQLMKGVIAYVPSSVVWGAFPHPNRPAWLLDNQPLFPFSNGLMSREETFTEAEDLLLACEKGKIPFHSGTQEDPYCVVDLFLARNQRHALMTDSAIPVERITAPLLLISGEDDKIWPSAHYTAQIMERLAQKGSTIERKSLTYPHAGHGIIIPVEGPLYHSIGKFWCTLGGTSAGNKQASESAWQETLNFLTHQ